MKLLAFLSNNTFIFPIFPCKLGPRQGFGFPFELRVMARPVLSPHRSDRSIFPWFPASRKQSQYIPVLHIIRSEIIHPEILIDHLAEVPRAPFNGFFSAMSHRVVNPLSCRSPMFGYQSPNVCYKPDRSCFAPVCNYSIQLHPAPTNQSFFTVSSLFWSKSNTSSLRFQALLDGLQKTLGILAETRLSGSPKNMLSLIIHIAPLRKYTKNEQVGGLLGFTIFLKHWNASRERLNISKHIFLHAGFQVSSRLTSVLLHPQLILSSSLASERLTAWYTGAACKRHGLSSDMGQIIRSSIRSQSQYNMELNWIVKHCEVSRKHQLIVGPLIESKLAANQTCVAQRRAANSTRAKQQKPDT